jgi:DNA-binding transcriptional LysR family regulator
MDGFVALPHVVISRRGRSRSQIDDVLAEHGRGRRVAVTVPTLALAIATVTDAALLTVAPAIMVARQLGPELRTFELPMPTPAIPAVLAWHARHERDGAHRWLRATIAETLAAISR